MSFASPNEGRVLRENVRRIPILGQVPAGSPGGWSIDYDAPDVLEDRLEIHDEQAIGLVVSGNSMYPTLFDGDTIVLSPNGRWAIGDIVVAEVAGSGESYLVKRLGRNTDDGDVVLISDNFLEYEPIVQAPSTVEIRGRVERVVRQPSRKSGSQGGPPELLGFYRDPRLATILQQIQDLSPTARQIILDNIATLAKVGVK